jgi:phospholipase C
VVMFGLTSCSGPNTASSPAPSATPISHLVVVYQENRSFDNYFGTYPHALNPPGEPRFDALAGTPSIDGLTPDLLAHNPNLSNPQRLDRSQAVTCDNDHGYLPEQQAFDGGRVDHFVQFTGHSRTTLQCTGRELGHLPDYAVMDYYDGNTVTALWRYAQRFAISDRAFSTTFGPSSPGHINLISGQTRGVKPGATLPGSVADGRLIGDLDPVYDDCNRGRAARVEMTGPNVGDLLNAHGVTWGWFSGGFRPDDRGPAGQARCTRVDRNLAGANVDDYSSEIEPFQFYRSTANPRHLPPTSPDMIGRSDRANHQYDLADFWSAAGRGHLPAVSFLKAAKYQNGHPGYSDPLDEQHFVVGVLNRLQKLPEWRSTAVIIAWDDADGWYDHRMSSKYGPRQPLLVISPYAKSNFVDHTVTDQSSILRLIEDNWRLGRIGGSSFDATAGSLNGMFDFSHGPMTSELILDPQTGGPRGSHE